MPSEKDPDAEGRACRVTLCYEMVRTAKPQRQNRGVGRRGAVAANRHRVSFGGQDTGDGCITTNVLKPFSYAL